MIFVRDIMHVLGEANYSKYTEKAERACREERLGICADRDVAKKKAYRRWQKKICTVCSKVMHTCRQASTHPVFAELTEMFSFGFLAYLQHSSHSHLYERELI